MNELPKAFVDRMAAQLGDELPAFLSSYREDYKRGVRMNPFKAAEKPEGTLDAVPWEEAGLYLTLESRAGAHVLHEAGAWYLQEPSAMLPAAVLDARPGERVLDLCAAPGGKSTQNGLRMRGEGTLVCNEPVPERARILSRNIERMGIPNAVVVSQYPDALAKCWPEAFDAIQCDAPCSGEGMFRRHPETRDEWDEASPAGCAKRQLDILDEAAKMLRPGGRIVYSTCTLNTIENEGVVEAFLMRHPDFALKPFHLPGVDAPQGMFTCWPHRFRGEGHFVALMVREERETSAMRWTLPKADKAALGALKLAEGVLFPGVTANDAYLKDGEWQLFRLPELPDGKCPKLIRRGLHIGSLREGKGGRKPPVFTPDHALALSIAPPEVPRIHLTEEEARAYQNGQVLPAGGKGWVLACCAGVPLGWGKVSDGVMKNHYPKGLRR